MVTTATRSSEPVPMIPFIFLKDNYLKNPFFGYFYTPFRWIKIRPYKAGINPSKSTYALYS